MHPQKEEALKTLCELVAGIGVKESEVQWVLTGTPPSFESSLQVMMSALLVVPAIWDHGAKQVMKEGENSSVALFHRPP
jgi:hypothetical protein